MTLGVLRPVCRLYEGPNNPFTDDNIMPGLFAHVTFGKLGKHIPLGFIFGRIRFWCRTRHLYIKNKMLSQLAMDIIIHRVHR